MSSVTNAHPDDDDLVLAYYGERPEVSDLDQHLGSCEDCRRRQSAIARLLATVDLDKAPEPEATFEARMWARIGPALEPRRAGWRAWLAPRRLALAGAVMSLVLVAFVAGREWPRPAPPAASTTAGPAVTATDRARVRQRILLVAVGEHLDRSQMALVEIANTDAAGGVDISGEQDRVRDLVLSNRLLRQSVEGTGDVAVASVLDDLERVMLDIAHGPSQLTAGEFDRIRNRIESEELIFKVRVAGSSVREREATVATNLPKIRS